MTLKQAQKQWPDAIEMSLTYLKDAITEQDIINTVLLGDKERKVLWVIADETYGYCIFSKAAYLEDQRQMEMLPGTKVVMTGDEARFYPNDVWTVKRGPQVVGGDICVWLEGYSGCYMCKYLKQVDA